MAHYKPEPSLREAKVVPAQAACLFIDTQNYNCHRDGACFQALGESPSTSFFYDGVQAAVPRWQLLQQTCRHADIEVLYTVIQSLTQDGRDRGLDYKISGFHVPPGCWDARVLEEISPRGDEIVLPKSSSSVFNSTVLHTILGNMGIKQLILCGCVADQCVEHAVRDACDLGYLVTLVSDASVTYSQERHGASLRAIKGYCRQRTTQQLCEELSGTWSTA